MIARNVLLGSALLVPLLSATPAQAQRVNASIIIGGGPISGRIDIGDRGRYGGRPRPIRRMEWVRHKDYRRADFYREFRRDSRVVVVYYDRRDDCYYLDRFRSDLQEIRVFERRGQYYRLEDDRDYDRDYGRYDDRDYGRYDNRDYGRHDNRYGDGRRDDRKDDRKDYRKDDRRGDHRGNYRENQRGNRRGDDD